MSADSAKLKCARRACLRFVSVVLAMLVFGSLAGSAARAQQPENAAADDVGPESDLSFRRVFAPADQIDAWPRGAQPYVPVNREEFERLIEVAEMTKRGAQGALAPRITAARYQARLVEDELIEGSGTLQIEHLSDDAALLVLNPCEVAISDASWADGGIPVQMGLDPRGRWVVVVPNSGTLHLKWSRRLVDAGPSVYKLPLPLPSGAMATLRLDLPDEFEVTGEAASVEEIHETSAEGAADEKAWQCAFAASGEPALLLRRQVADESPTRSATVSQLLAYQVTPEGLALNCELSLDVGNQSLTELELELDVPLQLVSATLDQRALRWSTVESAGRMHRITLEFDEPVVETAQVQLLALAPLDRERLAQFPRIRVRDIAWRQGIIRIAALSSLVIDDLDTHGCRQIKSEADTDGQQFEFQMFSSDGHVDALVRQREQRVQVSSASTITLGADEIRSAMSVEFTATEGRRFELSAAILPAWQLVSLVSDPPGAVESWRVEPVGEDARRLQVRLLHGLSVQQPLRLVIQARKVAPPFGTPIGVTELETLHFEETDRGDQLIELRAEDSSRLTFLSADNATALNFVDLDAARRRLFSEPATAAVYVIGLDTELVVALSPQQPRYSVAIEIKVQVGQDESVEQTVLRCVPATRPIQRLLVHFSKPTNTVRQWTLSGPMGPSVEVVPPSAEELQRLGSAAGAAVAIELPEPQTEPFELWSVRTLEAAAPLELGLVSVPDAAEQSGRISIEALPSQSIAMGASRLESEVPQESGDGRFTNTRAAYRFDPKTDFDPARPVVLTISTDGQVKPGSNVVVWSSRVDTTIESSGRGMHVARYWLENSGRRELKLEMPEHCHVNGVWVDGMPISRRVNGSKLIVQLPPANRYVEVMIQLESSGAELGLASVRTAVWPEPDAPVLARQSTINVPVDYELFASGTDSGNLGSSGSSWSQRLFGPFGRSSKSAPFGPVELDGWLSSVSQAAPVESNPALNALLARFGVAIESTMVAANAEGEGRPTWGQLLETWDAVAKSEQTPLLIDVHALAAAGIDAQTPLVDVARSVPRNQTLALLHRSQLTMALHGRTVILTTAAAVAAVGTPVGTIYGNTIVRDRSTAWDKPIQQANTGLPARLATVATWRVRSTWPWSTSGASGGDRELGRANVLSSADPTTALRYRLVDKTRLGLIGGDLFVAILSLALWCGRRFLPVCGAVTVVIAVAALVVPAWLVPISSSLMLAAFVFWGVYIFFPKVDSSAESSDSQWNRPAMAVARGIVLLVVAVSLGHGESSTAQDDMNGAAQKSRTPWVFVPVDGDRKPTGDRYHVPLEFDRRLRHFVSLATEQPQGWMLGEVNYRASFSWDAAGTQLQLESLRAIYNFESLDPLSTVRLPLPAGVGISNTVSARRNGSTLELPYDSDSHTFAVPVVRRGSHQVEVSLAAMVEEGVTASGFSLPIPRVPTSNVVVELPADAPVLEIDSALGRVARSVDGSTVEAELGGSNTLTVSWPNVAMRREMQPSSEVDELAWIRIEPDAVVVQAQFHLRVTSGSVDQLDLEVDPQLRLLPMGEEATNVSKAEYVGDGNRLIRFHLDPPVTEDATIAATFLLRDVAAIGRLNLPHMAVLGPRLRQRMLAVSMAPMFRADRAEGEGFDAVPTADFLAVWGNGARVPDLTYRLAPSAVEWSLPLRTAAPSVTATEALTVEFQRNHAEVELLVDLESEVGSTFQLSVRAPEALEVELVSTAVEPLVRRWTRLPSGDIAVFLDGAMTGPQQLRLRGTIPTPAEGDFVIPDMGMIGCETKDRRIEVYRRPSVLVTPLVGNAFAGEVGDGAPATTSPRRLVASMSGVNAVRELPVRLVVNQPQAEVTLVTALERKADLWQAEVDCLLEVRQGLVDLLKLEVPANWEAPLQLDPPLPHWIVPATGERPATLMIRPHTAVDSQLRLRITSGLDISSGQRVTAPTVAALDVQRSRSYIRLPDLAAMQRLEWETRGLLPSVLPDVLLEAEASKQMTAGTVYEVVGNDVQAVLRSTSKGDRVPVVWLADNQLVVHDVNAWYGVARFDIDPAGAESCPLIVPEGYELIRVRLGKQPATFTKNDKGNWDVMLWASDLPQQIEVVYRRLSPGAEGTRFDTTAVAAPTLGTLPVQRTLWTMHTAPEISLEPEDSEADFERGLEFALIRLGSLESSLRAASEVQVEHPADELERWAEPWLLQWSRAREQLEQKLNLSPSLGENPALQAEINLLDVEHAQAIDSLKLGGLHERLLREQGTASLSSDLLELGTLPNYTVRQISADGPLVKLPLSAASTFGRGLWYALAMFAAMAAGAWALWNADRRMQWLSFLRRWSLAAMVTGGILWWLYLSPSWLGWVIVLAALWYAASPHAARRASTASLSSRATAISR